MSRLGGPRNRTKATVRLERREDGCEVVVKDFTDRPWWVRRLIGRPLLRREARAYRRLSGVEGVPALHGFEGPDRLVLARATGRSLSEWDLGSVPEDVWSRLERLLDTVHGRGVAVVDLHRSNIIVSAAGEVAIVDFALALTAREQSGGTRPGRLMQLALRLDRHAIARLRARALGHPAPELPGNLGRAYRAGRHLKGCAHRLKRFGRS